MARILAVDWDRHEARYVLGSTTGENLKIRTAASVPLVDVAEGGNAPHPDVGGSLRAALAERKVAATTALVAVERASIELLHFTLPPAKDAELPEMVVNQAMRQSQLVNEQSVLDFVASDDNAFRGRNITAAVLSAEKANEITATCRTAGLKPKRLLLRSLASASLFGRIASRAERVCLLVNPVAEEVDLVFLVEDRVVFFRTVRLPKRIDQHGATRRLVAEISRTLMVAAQNELGDEKVERIYIFGGPGEHQDVVEQVGDQLLVPVTVINPFAAVEIDEDLVPRHPGRFAALLGMLADEALGTPPAIDFLHPRRPPRPLDRRRLAASAAGVVLAALSVFAYFVWTELSELDRQISQRIKQLRELDTLTAKVEKQRNIAASLRGWEASNVVWLDELRDLSLRFPSPRDMVVLRMTLSAGSGGGSIIFDGLVRDPAIVVRMERSIRDQYHEISSKRVQQRLREKSYAWHFESAMTTTKREAEQYRSLLAEWQDDASGGEGEIGRERDERLQQVSEP